jgi:lathosterol oxidase
MISEILFQIIGYDIWFYISHRILHDPKFYWIHKIHHEYKTPTWRETYHGHWIEGPFQSLGFLVPWTWMPFDWKCFLLGVLLVNARGMARHDAKTIWLIGNHHLLHHEHFSCNYGELWLDTLCGTAREGKRGLLGYLV